MSGEVLMENLPKSIQVIFDKNPKLSELITNPRLISNSPFIFALSQKLNYSAKGNEDEYFYRIVFKEGSSRELMTINSGELRGLPTTTCIEKGKISDVAGLERVELDNKSNLMPVLLGISLYSSIQNSLSYISNLCVDIRNHQILEGQARFERISETIVDIFNSIPDLALDKSLRDAYLSRIVKNNDDCYELYVSQREQLKHSLKGNNPDYNSKYYYENELYLFKDKLLTHPVFSVFERLVAGKICEIILSGNYSKSNIQRHRDFISKVESDINNIMASRISDLDRRISYYKRDIDMDRNLTRNDIEYHNTQIEKIELGVSSIKKQIFNLLGVKLSSFDLLSQLMSKDEIDVFLIGGNLIVNDMQLTSDEML